MVGNCCSVANKKYCLTGNFMKETFLAGGHIPQSSNTQRRIPIQPKKAKGHCE